MSAPSRRQVLAAVADGVIAATGAGITRVAIDGVDGAGKTVFADELADELRPRGLEVVRASVDDFHHPRAIRYRQGRDSPVGFFEDSYDYASLRRLLLDPLGPGGTRRFVRAIHDVQAERRVDAPVETAPERAVLLLDGIFLHRPELADSWDHSVFLDVPFEVSIPRGAQRGVGDPDPGSEANRRYVEGQRLYVARCRPRERASVVVDNTDLEHPRIVSI